MKKCIYCNQERAESEFTLEHVISQFLGGAQAPDYLKTRDVCTTCNSNLGLFADASFEKDFLVFNQLNECAYAFFKPENPTALPLRCMGVSELTPPDMKDGEVCEYWIGPLGEQIFWIRPSDDRMYWYSGGNPRTVKSVRTRAYFMWSINSLKNPMITWVSFRDAFVGRKVNKISCTVIDNTDLSEIGFSVPDEIDNKRIDYFRKRCGNIAENRDKGGVEIKNQIKMFLDYDVRFMAKLAVGLGNVFFGSEFNEIKYTSELLKALWYRLGDENPKIIGCGNFNQRDEFLKEQLGFNNGVTVTIAAMSGYVVVNLNISRKMNWLISIARIEDVNDKIDQKLEEGICLILFKSLNKCVELSLPDLIAHNSKSILNSELSEIEKMANVSVDYFKDLAGNIKE